MALLALLFTLLLSSFDAVAQHESGHHWRVSAVMSHTMIPTETAEGATTLFIPSWGLDLEYWFNEHWAIGLHNDLELETFEVERNNNEFIRRQFPVVVTADALWMPTKRWVLLAGPGLEFDPRNTLKVFRVGVEYEYHLPDHWDIAPAFYYDFRVNAFDTYSIGVGLGKRF